MSNLNQQLRQLVLRARDCPPRTVDRQRTLNKLMALLLNCGKLHRPHRQELPSNFTRSYGEIYQEAQQNLMLYLCDNLHKYDPAKGEVLTWVNFLLKKRFIPQSISDFRRLNRNQSNLRELNLDDLENKALEQYLIAEDMPFLDRVMQGLNNDPENIFVNTYVNGYPQANLKALIIKRLSGQSWKDISQEMGPGVSTLAGFYRRKIAQFKYRLRGLIS